jgi:hypothetical protein
MRSNKSFACSVGGSVGRGVYVGGADEGVEVSVRVGVDIGAEVLGRYVTDDIAVKVSGFASVGMVGADGVTPLEIEQAVTQMLELTAIMI